MKIAVNTRLLNLPHHTGIQNYICELVKNLKVIDEHNHYEFLGREVPNTLVQNIFFDSWEVRKKLAGCDIYHSPSMVLPAGKKICKYVVTIHDLGFKMHPEIGRTIDKLYFDLAVRRARDMADVIITDSEAVKDELKRFYNIAGERIVPVTLGVSDYFSRKESGEYISKIKRKYGLVDKMIILANSVHSARKNTVRLLEAFDLVCKKREDAVLVISGNLGLIKDVNRKNVLLLPYMPRRELRSLYQIADIFVYPSIYEGFGLPILEAKASGAKVLASDIPVVRELIREKEWLFDPLDTGDIGAKLVKTLMDNRKTGMSGHQICEKYSWLNTAMKTLSIYNSLR